MNCLEFRRRLGSDPASSLDSFVGHRAECPGCAAAQARADEFEARIRHAVNVRAPVNLADRILLAQTTELRHGSRNRRRGFTALVLAAAASIVVSIVVLQRPAQQMPTLAAMVDAHLHKHVVSAAESAAEVPKQDVIDIFSQRGVSLATVPEGVNFVHKCPAGPYKTVHMVMPEEGVVVSVVYVVDAPPQSRADFRSDGSYGREVPMGKGTLVMLAANSRGFDTIEDVWRSAIDAGVAQSRVGNADPGRPALPGSASWDWRNRVVAP